MIKKQEREDGVETQVTEDGVSIKCRRENIFENE